jgi:hypothetical protein
MDPAIRLYRKEKARKQKRDARKISQAQATYNRLCAEHRLQPLTTSKAGIPSKPGKVCACGAPCWGQTCIGCRNRNAPRRFAKSKAMKRRAA